MLYKFYKFDEGKDEVFNDKSTLNTPKCKLQKSKVMKISLFHTNGIVNLEI